ncbi:PIN domain-containing protein [Phytoactinopolyspora limicola]|uniref:PIN domain-containing protein n=1 Tax=Phytoactinopolyspora limicola TaxID=2715536 RepID=UPI00140BAE1D|nr:PIN domain-containing protein [Phytoactinopolyspora limicola]
MSRFVVVLDACVLVPISLADTLLRIAEVELYRPVWSQKILDEVRTAVLEIHPDEDPGRVDARLHSMNDTFEDACVAGWEPLVEGINLPDENDRHVVAAALRGHAEVIVTNNVRDFPAKVLEEFGLSALTPDEFLLDQLDLAPGAVLGVLRRQAAAARRPPLTIDDVLQALARASAPTFARTVQEHLKR